MKNNPLIIALFIVLTVIIVVFPVSPQQELTVQEIMVHADQYSYSPSRINVNQGDRVIINLMSQDVTHGFFLDGYEIQQDFSPGVSERIEFVADTQGKFRIRCSVVCGDLHPFMIGELVVSPNNPFTTAIKISIFLVILSIFAIWILSGREDDRIVIANS